MLAVEALEHMEAGLVAQARGEAALRLRLGQLLDALSRGGCFELGFSSLAAYGLERCERSARWVESACLLARRLELLPATRRAVASGRIGWSMAETLVRIATRESEATWLAVAQRCSVREMRRLVRAAIDRSGNDGAPAGSAASGSAASGSAASSSAAPEVDEEADETRTLTLTVDREDAWLFEATRTLLAQLGAHDTGAQLEALLAEGQETLLRTIPRESIELPRSEGVGGAQRRWHVERAHWRDEAEARCESAIPGRRTSKRAAGESATGDAVSREAEPCDEASRQAGLYDEASRQAALYDEATRQPGVYDEASRQAGIYDEASRQPGMSDEA
jgi:hypothetical protein